MTNWPTIAVPEDVRDDAREEEPTYGELLRMGIVAHQEALVNTDGELITEQPDPSEFGQVATVEDLEQLKNELSMANEPGVEIDAQEIISRIEDLETTLPRKVAEELR